MRIDYAYEFAYEITLSVGRRVILSHFQSKLAIKLNKAHKMNSIIIMMLRNLLNIY